MSTSYPAAIDTTNLTNPATTDKRNSPSLAGAQANQNDAIKAVETKIGTGASTPVANTLLFGTGTGTSSWTALTSAQLLATISDETGTGSLVFATTPTLVTPKVDTINEATGGNGTTINGVLLKSSKVNGSYVTDRSLTHAQAATGFPVQYVGTDFSAVATGTTVMPYDDTVPQNTEGDQYMTQAITPKSATNTLYVEATVFLSSSITTNLQAALFQDTTASAVAAVDQYQGTATGPVVLKLNFTMVAGTTSSTTFKIRAGSDGAATTTFNGSGAARKYGAITKSTMRIIEVAV